MPLFKQKMPAKQLATMLMVYTITGSLEQKDDGHTFAMGPELWPRNDAPNVLPETEKRTSWDQLSYAERFRRPMEVCFLRGWAISFIAERLLAPDKIRDAVFEHYAHYWELWSSSIKLDFRKQWESALKLYGLSWITAELKGGRNPLLSNPWNEDTMMQFIDVCSGIFVDEVDYNRNYSDAMRAELKREGLDILTNALNFSIEYFRHTQQSYKVVA
jgi:hypothetical protein